MSPISEARRRANEKYNAKAYDEIKIRVSKGRKAAVTAPSESVTVYQPGDRREAMERNNAAPGAAENSTEEA